MSTGRWVRRSKPASATLGNDAERFVENQHKLLATLEVAYLYKVNPPVHVNRSSSVRGANAVIFTAKAAADYLGHTGPGYRTAPNRPLGVEVKRVSAPPHQPDPGFALSRVKPHQARCLERIADAGGVAIVLLVYNGGQALFAVPWREMAGRWAEPKGERHLLRQSELGAFRVPQGKLYLPLRSVP